MMAPLRASVLNLRALLRAFNRGAGYWFVRVWQHHTFLGRTLLSLHEWDGSVASGSIRDCFVWAAGREHPRTQRLSGELDADTVMVLGALLNERTRSGVSGRQVKRCSLCWEAGLCSVALVDCAARCARWSMAGCLRDRECSTHDDDDGHSAWSARNIEMPRLAFDACCGL